MKTYSHRGAVGILPLILLVLALVGLAAAIYTIFQNTASTPRAGSICLSGCGPVACRAVCARQGGNSSQCNASCANYTGCLDTCAGNGGNIGSPGGGNPNNNNSCSSLCRNCLPNCLRWAKNNTAQCQRVCASVSSCLSLCAQAQ